MLGLDIGDAALAGYLTLLSGAIGALLWTRLNRIEAELATKAGRAELEVVRQELTEKADTADLEALRREMASIRGELAGMAEKADLESLRREMAIMRSDLTQVALVVGARRSEASEG
jgi:Tfp pilus assembly protein PilO